MILLAAALLVASALAGLGLWWFEAHRARAVTAIVLALALTLATGGWAEATRSLYARARLAVAHWMIDDDTPAAAFEPSGDPTLERRLDAQEPAHPRPAGEEPEALRDWQQTVRARLQALYGVDGAPLEVPEHTVGDPDASRYALNIGFPAG